MNYHHSYHAGNFADVVKHVILIELITFLKKKSAAFCYIDTHAGSGYHDLFAEFAAKNKEKMKPEVIQLPEEIDNHIAELKLEAYGVEIDKLDEEQIKYLNSWEEGT